MQDIDAPYGSWSLDVDLDDAWYQEAELIPLQLSPERQVLSFERDSVVYALKHWYEALEEADIMHQLRVGLLAGDCIVPILGRAYRDGAVVGYVMRQETPFDPRTIDSKDERLAVIREACDLVHRLHGKGIVHGDLKRPNLLRCADGALRFIDLECMSVVGDGFIASMATAEYISQRRMLRQGVDHEPLSFNEDYHSLALLIFEIYTARDDFYSIGPSSSENEMDWSDVCCDASQVGMPPDVSRIDDPEIAQLMMSYFNRGPERVLILRRPVMICMRHDLPLRCLPDVQHTYSRLIRCFTCTRDARPPPCPNLFVAPVGTRDTNSPACTQCLSYVTHVGLN